MPIANPLTPPNLYRAFQIDSSVGFIMVRRRGYFAYKLYVNGNHTQTVKAVAGVVTSLIPGNSASFEITALTLRGETPPLALGTYNDPRNANIPLARTFRLPGRCCEFVPYVLPVPQETVPDLLWLRFEGLNGSQSFVDESTRAVNPTVVGSAQLTTTNPINGVSSGLFNGNGYIFCPGLGTVTNNTSFTMVFKFRAASVSGVQVLVSDVNVSTSQVPLALTIYLNGNNLIFTLNQSGTEFTVPGITIGTLYTVKFTNSSAAPTTISFSVNGVLIGSVGGVKIGGSANLYIGAYWDGQFKFNGTMDDFKINTTDID